jgi:queuine tRNA-ribosyltransferase
MLLSWHNTAFFQALMQEIRASIAEGRFEALRARLQTAWASTKSKPRAAEGEAG